MRTLLTQVIFVVMALFAAPLVVAQSEGPGPSIVYRDEIKRSIVSVIVPDSVKTELGRLPVADKKRVVRALGTGATFIKLYLDALACYTDYPNYGAEMSEFVEDLDSIAQICSSNSVPQKSTSDGEYTVRREVCPQTSLKSFKLENGGVTLTYQTTEVGEITEFSATAREVFNSENSGKNRQVVVTVNSNNKVSKFVVGDKVDQVAYERTVAALPYELRATGEQIRRHALRVCQ